MASLKFVALALLFVRNAHAQVLQIVDSEARLPTSRGTSHSLYDGEDTIFVIGGVAPGLFPIPLNDVSQYSLRDGTTKQNGRFLHFIGGEALLDGENITYFGGSIELPSGARPEDIHTYSTRTGHHSVVGTLPSTLHSFGLVWDSDARFAYLFGGRNATGLTDKILRYNANTQEVQQVGTLPSGWDPSAAVWTGNATAYLFRNTEVMQFDSRTNAVKKLPVTLPYNFSFGPEVVFAEGAVYLLDDSHYAMRFDPLTLEAETIDIRGWYMNTSSFSMAFIPTQRRIYVLGGYERISNNNGYYTNRISYIDLASESTRPPTTTTEQNGGAGNTVHDGQQSFYSFIFSSCVTLTTVVVNTLKA